MKKNTVVILLALSVGIYGWAISLLSIFKTGLGWDSVFDLNAAKISLENSNTLNLETYYEIVPITSEFYGTLVYKIANFLSLLFKDRSIFEDTGLIDNYYFIDLTTWFISLVSVILVCLSLYLVFESTNIPLLFFGLISSLPIWVGMSQVNSKDIPVAAGLTILSSGLMLILAKNNSRPRFCLGLLLTSFGAGIALSVRPATYIIIVIFLFLNTLIFLVLKLKTHPYALIFKDIFYTYIVTISFSSIMLFFSNPISLNNLLQWIQDSIRVSLNYPSIQPVKVFGRDLLSNDLPFWYVIAWVWAQLPILTFLSLFLSLILLWRKFFINKDLTIIYSMTPFAIQSLCIPILFVFTRPNLYNGVRHFLFIYPSLMVLTAFLLHWMLTKFQKNYCIVLSNIFVCLVLASNAFATHRWVPYSYAFINPIAGLGNNRNWDLDYWGLSSREGIGKLIELGYSKNVIVMPDNSSSIPFGSHNANQTSSSNFPFSLYVFIHWNHKILEENCKIDFNIKRDNQILGMGGHCFKNF
jgi:hypothetical protein